MSWQNEIYNILYVKGITVEESNKAIFGIAAIGAVIGKDKLISLVNDSYSMEDRRNFNNDVILASTQISIVYTEIIRLALDLISMDIDGHYLPKIVPIVLETDLKETILNFEGFANESFIREYSGANVPWLNDLAVAILGCHEGKSVLNAGCGTGDFLTKISNRDSINKAIGYTFNQDEYKICQIKSFFSESDITTCLQNTFSSVFENKVDKIYCSYPLMFNKDKEKEIEKESIIRSLPFVYKKKMSPNFFSLMNMLESMNDNGVMVTVVPDGVLFNVNCTEMRKYLVDNGYIKAIITLPGGIFPGTPVSSSMLIIEKAKENNRRVKMINAEEIYQQMRRYRMLSNENIEEIVKLYLSDEDDLILNISTDEIIKQDYYLGIDKYKVALSSKLVNPVMLGDVCRSIFRGYQITSSESDSIASLEDKDTGYRIINMSDLQPLGIVSEDLQAVEIEDTRKFSKYCVEEGDILITAKNTTIKSAVYQENEEYKAILTGNLIAVRVNEKKVNPFYLKAFMDSETGQEILRSIQTGTTVKSITPNSLKNMQIPLPDMDKQKEIATEYRLTVKDAKRLLDEYKIIASHLPKIYDIKIGY